MVQVLQRQPDKENSPSLLEKEGDAKARLVEKKPNYHRGYLCVFADGGWIGWDDVRWKCNKKACLVRF